MATPLFHVKICGITTAADARLAAEAGADAVGFNFVPGSPRQLDRDTASEAVAALPPDVLPVGVFAGMDADEILTIARHVGLRAIQLHGRLEKGPAADPPERCGQLRDLPVIRAVRLAEPGPSDGDRLAAARRWLAAAAAAGRSPAMVLVDAGAPPAAPAGLLGGTGRLVDWGALAAQAPLGLPLALAGGLNPENVAAAIRAAGVAAVDTASGVEEAPGRKNPALMKAFADAARAALGPSS